MVGRQVGRCVCGRPAQDTVLHCSLALPIPMNVMQKNKNDSRRAASIFDGLDLTLCWLLYNTSCMA